MKRANSKDSIATAMAAEATELSPDFSAPLHAKIMRRIDDDDRSATAPAAIRPDAFRLPRYLVAASIAAVLLITASVIFLKPPNAVRPKVVASLPSMPPLPPIDNPVDTLTGPVGTSLADARYAYLDRDASNVMHYMEDQVNVLPAAR